MRIIAGQHRGRRLVPPPGMKPTRPVTDKVKETMFNKLASHGMLRDEPAGRVLDVFAGTGSLGLEALSRGAAHCRFIERSRAALRGLRQNLDTLGLNEKAEVIESDGLNRLWRHAIDPGSLRVAFLDPPYDMMRQATTRRQLLDLTEALGPALEPGGVIVLRGPAEDEAMPAAVAGLNGPATDRFKKMAVHYYQKPFAETHEPPESAEPTEPALQ